MASVIEVGTTPWTWDLYEAPDLLCEQAQQAERLGFHSFWLPENHFGERGVIPSPLLLLAAVAARTSRIRLGTTSFLLPIRPPLLAAEDVAVLDQLSGGRLILGVGRGLSGGMFRAFGVDAKDKRKLFRANLDIMLRAWRGEPVALEKGGKPLLLAPRPLQQPAPPIWVAAFGPLALRQVATLGLPYLASPVETLPVLEENYRLYRAELAAAGHPPVPTVPVMRSVFVTEDAALAERARMSLEQLVPPSMQAADSAAEGPAIVGDAVAVRDKLAEYVERLGISHLILRGGIPGIEAQDHLRSNAAVLDIVQGL
ncbi:MAG: LLM class flavin-dependent oxidoreductase [Halieaceae bacterium]|nr:LLM class flavin-dependent oxidoreductase [Halieaceae bacterium]